MNKIFIPYEKLSKKQQKEIDSKRRGSWNGVVPVTRSVPNAKAYTRKGRNAGRFAEVE